MFSLADSSVLMLDACRPALMIICSDVGKIQVMDLSGANCISLVVRLLVPPWPGWLPNP